MEAADESDPEESAAPSAQPVTGAPSRRAAVEGRVVAAQARARRLAERAQDERARHASVDVAFEMVDRAEIETRDGRRLPLAPFGLDGGTWGGSVPVDLDAVSRVRLLDADGRVVLEASPPAYGD